jgi:hypothetical protein
MELQNVTYWKIESTVAKPVGELSGTYSLIQVVKVWTLNGGEMTFNLISDSEGVYLIER